MKKLLLFLLLIVSAGSIQAQDVIVKKDGTTIVVEIISKAKQKVEFRKWDSSDSTIYSLNFKDIFSINYADGRVEQFQHVYDYGSIDFPVQPGTLIPIKTIRYMKATDYRVGDRVNFIVGRDVMEDGKIVIPYGTPVNGTVYEAKRSMGFGTKGRLGIRVNSINLPDGRQVPLNESNVYVTGKNRTTLSVLLCLFLFWPACFICGTKAEILPNTEFLVTVGTPYSY